MPSCRITNYTSQPLNVALKHICALHFENEIQPGQTIKLKPGRVWFTLEVLVDTKSNQYSATQSAAAIAIVSLAAIGTVATLGGSALAASGGSAVVGAAATTGGSIVALGETAVAGFASTVVATGSFLAAHAGTAAKISAALLPKAIELVEKEVGGFTAVQKEVISIISSPNVAEDVKKSGMSILTGLANAYAADRAADRAAEAETSKQGASRSGALDPPPPYTAEPSGSASTSKPPPLKRAHSSVSSFLSKVSSPEARMERKAAKQEAKVAKQVASWEVVEFDADAEPMVLSSKELLRIHGLFMNERRHFEVREKAGKLVLVDANTKEVVAG